MEAQIWRAKEIIIKQVTDCNFNKKHPLIEIARSSVTRSLDDANPKIQTIQR